jgi:serine/threonine protein kinase
MSVSTDAKRTSRARLLREAQAMARLSHPNMITVHDVGTMDDGVFIAMEFLEGGSLRAWLRAQPRGHDVDALAQLEALEQFVATTGVDEQLRTKATKLRAEREALDPTP